MYERHVSIVGLSLWFTLEGIRTFAPALGAPIPPGAGTSVLVYLVIWPLLVDMARISIGRFGGRDAGPMHPQMLVPWVVGGVLLALHDGAVPSLHIAAWLLLGATGILVMLRMVRALPRESVVDRESDPLTKGDDACFSHIRFSTRFLPLALLLSFVGAVAAIWSPVWAYRSGLAGGHVFAIGHLLLLIYALGHFWIPRFSGIPAIAAGAIKGELHSTLLGLTGLTIGFLTGIRGIMSGLGFFVFVGFFTYMGVLGANMMKRKSQTHRVTPEFVYIPWTFTGIFWLISAVLMGLFLNAVPDVLADRFGALRDTHVAAALLGGMLQLWLGWQTRIIPQKIRFEGAQRASFFAFNAGVTLWIWSGFGGTWQGPAGLVLMASGLLLFGPVLAKLMAASAVEAA